MFFRYNMWSGSNPPGFLYWLMPFVVIDLILRGLALWRSAQKKEKWWFVALLVVNSMGILPGVYLLTHLSPKPAVKKN